MNNLRSFLLAIASLILLSQTTQAHYDPTIGRFINRDPIAEEGGANLYGFVGNRPIKYIDPLGLSLLNPGSVGAFGMNKGLVYSCYCGWLDGSHFQFGADTARSARNQLDSYLQGGTGKYSIGFGPKTAGGFVPGIGQSNVTTTFNGVFTPNPDEAALNSIAIQGTMNFLRAYEQSQVPNNLAAKALGSGVSAFSAEDLPSYYLGALIGLRLYTIDDIKDICGALTPDESKVMFNASHRPMENHSHRPALWSDDDGDCGCYVHTPPSMGQGRPSLTFGSSRYVSAKCPCNPLDPAKKAKADALFDLLK
jgi:hypothetical protein